MGTAGRSLAEVRYVEGYGDGALMAINTIAGVANKMGSAIVHEAAMQAIELIANAACSG